MIPARISPRPTSSHRCCVGPRRQQLDVVEEDDQHPEAEEGEHQDRHPPRADLRSRWGSAACSGPTASGSCRRAGAWRGRPSGVTRRLARRAGTLGASRGFGDRPATSAWRTGSWRRGGRPLPLAAPWVPGCSSSTTTTRSSTTSSSTWASSAPSRSCTATTRSPSTRSSALDPDAVLDLARARAAPRTPGCPTRSSATSPAGGPVLGVCLGHQCIGQVFGGEVVRAPAGHARQDVARSATTARRVRRPARTRSRPPATTRWSSTAASVPDVLEITAETDDGMVMGLRHREHDVEGVQFHPESILTVGGHDLLRQLPRPGRRRRPADAPTRGVGLVAAVVVAVGRRWCVVVDVGGRRVGRRLGRRSARSPSAGAVGGRSSSAADGRCVIGRRPGVGGRPRRPRRPGSGHVDGTASVRRRLVASAPRRRRRTRSRWSTGRAAARRGTVVGVRRRSAGDVGPRHRSPTSGTRRCGPRR